MEAVDVDLASGEIPPWEAMHADEHKLATQKAGLWVPVALMNYTSVFDPFLNISQGKADASPFLPVFE